ncbi:hypothetical protein F4809DRAFT_659750 [Biscogniauxia mediterranea]|nr:hypothetical protein F4809DRAFT_659750 [Biscogniauxia mediterranea]
MFKDMICPTLAGLMVLENFTSISNAIIHAWWWVVPKVPPLPWLASPAFTARPGVISKDNILDLAQGPWLGRQISEIFSKITSRAKDLGPCLPSRDPTVIHDGVGLRGMHLFNQPANPKLRHPECPLLTAILMQFGTQRLQLPKVPPKDPKDNTDLCPTHRRLPATIHLISHLATGAASARNLDPAIVLVGCRQSEHIAEGPPLVSRDSLRGSPSLCIITEEANRVELETSGRCFPSLCASWLSWLRRIPKGRREISVIERSAGMGLSNSSPPPSILFDRLSTRLMVVGWFGEAILPDPSTGRGPVQPSAHIGSSTPKSTEQQSRQQEARRINADTENIPLPGIS